MAGTAEPLNPADAATKKRLEIVGDAVKANGGTVGNAQIEPLLSNQDQTNLPNAGVKLAGIDEVIFMEIG
jgi:hypothetical protein